MEKMKAAVIGTGSISPNHLRNYVNNPYTELYALCDLNRERALAKAAEYEMFRTLPEIELVSVCTWNSAHAECTIAALNAGCNVLCEKPMAVNAAQALEMQAAAEKNGKLLMIGFVRRHEENMKVLQDFVHAGFFGDIYYAKATYLRRNGHPGGWFGDKSRSGGGPLIDLGVHVIDFVRYLKGNPKTVSVYGATYQKLFDRANIKSAKGYIAARDNSQDKPPVDVEDLVTALIRFDDGSTLSVEASFSLNGESKGGIELFGSKAGAHLADDGLHLYSEMHDRLVNIDHADVKGQDFDQMFRDEVHHFIDCVANGTECIAPAEDGVELMRILDAVYESAATGHEVVL